MDRLYFQIDKRINHDIFDLLNKAKTPSPCGFPLANLQSGEGLYCVPKSNLPKAPILLYICYTNGSIYNKKAKL